MMGRNRETDVLKKSVSGSATNAVTYKQRQLSQRYHHTPRNRESILSVL